MVVSGTVASASASSPVLMGAASAGKVSKANAEHTKGLRFIMREISVGEGVMLAESILFSKMLERNQKTVQLFGICRR